jgi:hypothetical protein
MMAGSLVASVAVAGAAGWVAWQGAGVGFDAAWRGLPRVLLIAGNALALRVPTYSLRRWAQSEPWLVVAAALGVALLGAVLVAWRWRRGGARGGPRGVAPVVGAAAVVAAPLLPLAPFGWMADRHAYLPLGLLLVVVVTPGARWLGTPARRRLLGGGAVVALVAVLLGAARTSVWVDNARLAATWCESFRDVYTLPVDGVDASRRVVVAGFPAQRGGAPVFSNDLPQALAFCRGGRGAASLDVLALGPLESPASVRDPGTSVEVTSYGGHPFAVEVRALAGHFGRAPGPVRRSFGAGRATGAVEHAAVSMEVAGIDSAGDLTAFRVEIPGASNPAVLAMAPGGFRLLQ